MKKISLSFLAFVLLICQPTTLLAQSDSDYSLILTECINLIDLQKYVIDNHPEPDNPVPVFCASIPIAGDAEVKSFSRTVEFVSESEISNRPIDAYFHFKTLEISGNTGNAAFSYVSNIHEGDSSATEIEFQVRLQKSPNGWYLTERTITEK